MTLTAQEAYNACMDTTAYEAAHRSYTIAHLAAYEAAYVAQTSTGADRERAIVLYRSACEDEEAAYLLYTCAREEQQAAYLRYVDAKVGGW